MVRKINALQNESQKVLSKDYMERTQEVYNMLTPILRISQVFLCAPGLICDPFKQYPWSRKFACYALQFIWANFIYGVLIISAGMEYDGWLGELLSPEIPLALGELAFVIIHALFVTCSVFIGRRKFRQYITYMINFDIHLCHSLHLNLNEEDRKLKRFIRNHIRLVFLYAICASVAIFSSKRFRFLAFLYSNTASVIPNLIINFSLIQYYMALYGIYERMQILNNVLRQSLCTSSSQVDNKLDNIEKFIRDIRKFFTQLEDFTIYINNTFGLSLFILFLDSFLNIVCSNFWLYRKTVENCDETGCTWIIHYIIWDCLHISKLFFVIYYNQGILNQKKATIEILNTYDCDEFLQPTFNRFILQMACNTCSNVICSMLTIDMKLITTILTSAVTLIVFFIQYFETYRALTTEHNTK